MIFNLGTPLRLLALNPQPQVHTSAHSQWRLPLENMSWPMYAAYTQTVLLKIIDAKGKEDNTFNIFPILLILA